MNHSLEILKIESITGTVTLIDDTYSHVGYCRPTFFINVTSDIQLSTLYFRDLNGAVPDQYFDEMTNGNAGTLFYISGYITSDFFQINSATTLHAKDSTYNNEQNINAIINYVCEKPPIIEITEPVSINIKPLKIENKFKVYVANLKKRIQMIDQIIPVGSQLLPIMYVGSEPYFIEFQTSVSISTIGIVFNSDFEVFNCTYDVNQTFILKIQVPMKYHINTSIDSITQYPNSPYDSSNNWNINNIVFLNGSLFDSNLFFYSIYNSTTIFDKNQYFSLVSGNNTKGQYLFLSSSFPIKRDMTPTAFSSDLYVYGNQTSFSKFSISNKGIGSNIAIEVITSSNLFLKEEFSFDCLYPDNYKIAIKYGDGNYFQPTYPYGLSKLESNGSCSFNFQYALNNLTGGFYVTISTDVGDATGATNPSPNGDSFRPILDDFQIFYPRGGDGNYAILTVKIRDVGSGFSYLYYGGNYVTVADLINGTINDGYYQKLIYVTFDFTCLIGDIASNIFVCSAPDDLPLNQNFKFYYGVFPLKSIPYLVDFDFEITSFNFESSVYDLSESGRLVTVFLNYSKSQLDIPISFFLTDRNYGDKFIDINSKSNRYLMDKELHLFKITFYIPQKLCTGTLPYLFVIHGKQFRNDYFNSKFGDQANLNIFSNECFELPPKFTSLSYKLNSPITLDSNKIVGWDFEINSGGDIKISYVFFHVISNLDKKGYTFEFYPNSTTYSSSILINVSPLNTPTQTFIIYNATIIDERGIRSDHIDNYKVVDVIYNQYSPLYALSISPFYSIDKSVLSFKVLSPFTREYIKPNISLSNILKVETNDFLDSSLYLKLTTNDDVGISLYHIPQVYIEHFTNYGDFQVIQCITKTNQTSTLICEYDIICNVEYGFGLQNPVTFSVYGVVDTSLNIASFNSLSLNQSISMYSITNSIKPSISSWTPLTPKNNRLTIFGRNLPTSGGNAFLYYTDSDSDNLVTLIFNFSSSVMAVLEIGSSIKPFILYTQNSNNIKSNSVEIHYLEGSSSSSASSSSSSSSDNSTLPPVTCLDSCGGSSRGTCIPNVGCRCKPPYSGINCLSETIKIPKPQTNTTSPDSRNEFPVNGTDIKLNTIISIVALREFDFQGKQVNIHYFDSWNFTTISPTNFTYSSSVTKNNQYVSNVTVSMEWYEQSSVIKFANQNFTINPSSLKYYIKLDQYPFSSSLNTLDLIIKSSFKSSQTDDVCGSKGFTLNDGNDYMTLQIGKYSFEGKFIKKAIINGIKVITVNNKWLDNNDFISNTTIKSETDSSNQQSSFVSIQIPHYNSNVLLDPSFSVLLDSNENTKNSICSPSDSSKLSVGQIVGIAIGCAVLVIILFLFIFFKFSKSQKFLSVKIFFYKLFKSFKRKY
ncbi:hypothetical protein RB653_002012 [Dictyostelium firmibasis]|uniref:EGF-like domain-containing protein n=1 Tax=Dictyostelium firmibasis TaxID=79012 RepID=A0AAN7TPW9_9MYCE